MGEGSSWWVRGGNEVTHTFAREMMSEENEEGCTRVIISTEHIVKNAKTVTQGCGKVGKRYKPN